MNRLQLFHFEWKDAWYSPCRGYDTILESRADGRLLLKCIVDMSPRSIDLTGKEDEMIKSIEESGISKLNGKKYIEDCLDGHMWRIDIAYDDKVIRASGDNAYPPEFWAFLGMMIKDWNIKKSVLVGPIKAECKKYQNDYRVEPMNDDEATLPSYIV